MKPLYYYEDYIHNDRDIVKEYIAFMEQCGEETLLRLCENEIYIIEDLYELQQWCHEYGYNMEDLYEEFGIDLFEMEEVKWINY